MPALTHYLQQVVIVLFAIVCYSCRNSNDKAIIKALDESIETSNKTITYANDDILLSLESKLYEPATHEKAKIWYTKAKKIDSLSNEILSYIDKFETDDLGKEKTEKLYKKLIEYKNEVLKVDSFLYREFNNNLILTTRSFDTLKNKQKDFYSTFFKNTSKEVRLTFLKKLQNNIKIIENKTKTFCHEQVGIAGGWIEYSTALIAQSSTYTKANEKIEITAGVGSFETFSNPEIFINNKKRELNEMGYVSYSFKGSDKPGKHYIPVRINFTDQFGIKQSIKRNVEYTVAKECN